MKAWADPVWLIWLVNTAAAFLIGSAFGQDKVRFERRRNDE